MDELNLYTTRYNIDIELDERVGRIVLTDNYTGVRFADSDYRYSAVVECGGHISRLEGLWSPHIDEELPDRGGRIVTVTGLLGAGTPGPRIKVRHRFYIPEDGEFFEERIHIINESDAPVSLRGYRFAFRKRLERPEEFGGPGIDIEHYRLIALPFRLQPDGKKHDYPLDDIYHGRYQCSDYVNPTRVTKELVDRGRARSEGWAWTDGENGLLAIKYNPDMIEYSMLETEIGPPMLLGKLAPEASSPAGECFGEESLPKDPPARYLNFGGAAPSLYDEPFEATKLGPAMQVGFGLTHYLFYEGLWRQGSYLFRDYMSALGHGLPDGYDPPVTWSVSTSARTIDDVAQEACRAAEIGCEAVHLGSMWETCEGATRWDEERLGEPGAFVQRMEQDYGLKVGLRVIGRSYCDEFAGMYRRTFDGNTGYYSAYSEKPWYEPCISCDALREEKRARILAVADAGASFMVFDEFDWRGPCFDGKHGHKVPTTPGMHSKAVALLIREVRQRHPNLLIEAHDPVWPWGVRYLPIYYLHDAGRTFDEAWAFELSANSLEHLLSGRALSLFYYRLGYDLPLYLQINMDADNDNCLAFWWYASTVRHLGISGGRGNPERFAAYKRALAEYMSMKELYVAGRFYAFDELTHFHVLPEQGRCVMNAFNLTDTPISRTIDVRLADLELMEEVGVDGAPFEMTGGKLTLELGIPPFSPLVVRMEAKPG